MKDKIILVYMEDDKIIGTGSIQFEYKLSHGGYPVGHIEDVVVLPEYRKKGIGQLILSALREEAIWKNAYKIVLSCSDINISFYYKNGFRLVENTMRMDL
jgi:GNAT superfamily N-acetyltransferase